MEQQKQAAPKKKNKVWNVISTILVVIIVLLALALVGARLLGLQVFSVLSGSMEPTYHVGSVIYVKKVDPFTIKEGQVITFMLNEDTIATHRVVAVVPDENDSSVVRFLTKGDANDYADGTVDNYKSLVHYKNVVGRPVFTLPLLGYVANYIQHPPGMYIAIAAAVVVLMMVFIPDLFDDDKKGKTQKEVEGKKEDQEGALDGAEKDPAKENENYHSEEKNENPNSEERQN